MKFEVAEHYNRSPLQETFDAEHDNEYATYLLTWNPREYAWENIEEQAEATYFGQTVRDTWSCGRRKHISAGDHFFLLRQGVMPKGIMASGTVTSRPYLDAHWKPDRSVKGDNALYVRIIFDRILNPEIGDTPLDVHSWRKGPLSKVHWNTQSSGIWIREGASELELLWRQHLNQLDSLREGDEVGFEGALKWSFQRHRTREKRLREKKIIEHSSLHKGRLPCEVPGCGFEFQEVYGEIGKDHAQVHHLKPLHDRTRLSETKLSDLAVVCANCHSMIHRGGKNRDLKTLIPKRVTPSSMSPDFLTRNARGPRKK